MEIGECYTHQSLFFLLGSWLVNMSTPVPPNISVNKIKAVSIEIGFIMKVYMRKEITGYFFFFLCSQGYGKTEEEGEC